MKLLSLRIEGELPSVKKICHSEWSQFPKKQLISYFERKLANPVCPLKAPNHNLGKADFSSTPGNQKTTGDHSFTVSSWRPSLWSMIDWLIDWLYNPRSSPFSREEFWDSESFAVSLLLHHHQLYRKLILGPPKVKKVTFFLIFLNA